MTFDVKQKYKEQDTIRHNMTFNDKYGTEIIKAERHLTFDI